MVRPVLSVYDSKSKVFGSPFVSVNQDVAKRDFSRAVNDPNSQLFHNPEDFNLFILADFDDESGQIAPRQPFENLGLALQHKKEV